MRTCLKCGDQFKIYARINGEQKNLGMRKYCLKCSPYKKHNTTQLHVVNKSFLETERFCFRCKQNKKKENFYLTKYGTIKHSYCKDCIRELTKERQRKIKIQAVEYKGGRCVICSYSKYYGALTFHHVNPQDKDFDISRYCLKSFASIKKELDKCALLCRNCHAEVENGITRLPTI